MQSEATNCEAPTLKQLDTKDKVHEPSPMSTGSTRGNDEFGAVDFPEIVDVEATDKSEEYSAHTPMNDENEVVAGFKIPNATSNHHVRHMSAGEEPARHLPLEAFPKPETLRI